MGRKVISFSLSEESIAEAIRDLNSYKNDIVKKSEQLRDRVAERISLESQRGFDGAIISDIINGSPKYAKVSVSVEKTGAMTLVIAKGEDAVWVEFGAGVYYNGSAGSSPHPKGSELGFIIGGYGYGMGKKKTWGFYEDGDLFLTRGAPAKMPMYNALKSACDEISIIAQEVFT